MVKTVYIPWTVEAEQLLAKLWKQNKTASDIAKIMNRPRNAIIGKVHRLRLAKRGEGMPSISMPRAKNTNLARPIDFRKTSTVPLGAGPVAPTLISTDKSSIANRCFGDGVKIMDLKSDHCCWPVGDPKTPEFRYCGARRTHKNYCDHHQAASYVPQSGRKKADAY